MNWFTDCKEQEQLVFKFIINVFMNKHYLHHKVSFSQDIHSLRPYHSKKDAQQLYTVMASTNRVELHRVLPDGLALQHAFQFYADIAKVEVLSSRFSDNDYLWILDTKGRYATWTANQGLEFVQNLPIIDLLPDSHQSLLSNSDSSIFSGVNAFEGEQDETGLIFFAFGTKITILEYVINKQGCFLTATLTQNYSQTCKEIRFMNWITNNTQSVALLGIVVEKQEGTTVLQVYQIERGQKAKEWRLAWTVEKKNLLQFYSPVSLQILLLTYDEVALYKYKQGPICCYRTGGNYGQGFYIGDGLYGQVGKQLILFNKEKLIPLNNYHLPDQHLFEYAGLKECLYLGHFQGVGAVLCLLTTDSQLYFLTILGQQCKVCKLNEGLPLIESLKLFPQIKDVFALVGRCRKDEYGLFLCQKVATARVLQWQQLSLKVDSFYATVRGSYLVFNSGNNSFVARLTKNNDYAIYFQLPDGEILAIQDQLLVTEQGIYQIDYQTQNCYKFVEADIVMAQIINETVYYLDPAGIISMWSIDTKKPKQIAANCEADFYWASSKHREMLICANLHDMTRLRLITQETIRLIPVKGHTIITSLATISPNKRKTYDRFGQILNENLVIGYCDGSIHVQSIDGHIVKVFKLRHSERIHFTTISHAQIIARCGHSQYLLNCQADTLTLTTVQLAHHSTQIEHLVYLEKAQQFLLIVNSRLDSKPILLRSSIHPSQLTSHLTRLEHSFDSRPFIVTTEHTLFYAVTHAIGKIDLNSNHKTQSHPHQLIHVSAFEKTGEGLLLAGKHTTHKQTILLYNEQLEVLFKCFCAVSGQIQCLPQAEGTTQFMVWSDNNVSFHLLSPQTAGLKLLFGSNVNCRGHQCDISAEDGLFVLNDSEQCVSVFSFAQRINLVCRYVAAYQVVGCSFFGSELIIFDERGQVTLFSTEKDQFSNQKLVLTKQWNLDIGQTASAYCKHNQKLYYITENATIYCITQIEADIFQQLRTYQEENTQYQNHNFNYAQWRRKTKADRLIDCSTLYPQTSHKQHTNPELVQLLVSLFQD